MSDGALSQDEIDALLQGTDDITESSGGMMDLGGGGGGGFSGGGLSQQEISAFMELVNDASANVGGALGAMVGKSINISNPRVEAIDMAGIQNQLSEEVVEVKMDFEAGVIGEHSYLIEVETAKIIGGLMMGQEGADLTDASMSAVSEAMNIIAGNASNTIGTKIKKDLKPTPPVTGKKDKGSITLTPGAEYVKVLYDFSIEGYPPSQLVEVYALNIVKEITASVMPATSQGAPMGGPQMGGQQMGMGGQQPNMMGGMQQPNMMGMQQPNMMGMQQPNMMGGMQPNMMGMQQNPNMMGMGMQQQPNMMGMGAGSVPIQGVQFSNLGPAEVQGAAGNINLLYDVNMEMTVELGRTQKSIKEILGMGEGTVIELDKLAGEPVDVLVNGKLIAKGEVVVIDENFGVRVTEIVNPMDRIASLT